MSREKAKSDEIENSKRELLRKLPSPLGLYGQLLRMEAKHPEIRPCDYKEQVDAYRQMVEEKQLRDR